MSGLVPVVEGTGEPYGISRDVVEGAARAGGALNPSKSGQDPDLRPMPALSQVTATPAPQSTGSLGENMTDSTDGTDSGKGKWRKNYLGLRNLHELHSGVT